MTWLVWWDNNGSAAWRGRHRARAGETMQFIPSFGQKMESRASRKNHKKQKLNLSALSSKNEEAGKSKVLANEICRIERPNRKISETYTDYPRVQKSWVSNRNLN